MLQAKKTKEVLSANTEAPISVEELHNGIDFRSGITRCALHDCLSEETLHLRCLHAALLPVLKTSGNRRSPVCSFALRIAGNVQRSALQLGQRGCRADFERLAGGFFTAAAKPLRTILERNSLTGKLGVELKAVELLGGGSRVPAVQAALSDALGGRTLDK